jgi:hypothetical protein
MWKDTDLMIWYKCTLTIMNLIPAFIRNSALCMELILWVTVLAFFLQPFFPPSKWDRYGSKLEICAVSISEAMSLTHQADLFTQNHVFESAKANLSLIESRNNWSGLSVVWEIGKRFDWKGEQSWVLEHEQ